MRISDWSSDVCSSDLRWRRTASLPAPPRPVRTRQAWLQHAFRARERELFRQRRQGRRSQMAVPGDLRARRRTAQIGRAAGRERVCKDVEISVVAESLKKKNIYHQQYDALI